MGALVRDTGTASLFAPPPICESIGRARQRRGDWLAGWTSAGTSSTGSLGPWKSAEVSGPLTGADGTTRSAVVTLAEIERWQVLAVHVDGKLFLPCPLDPADEKKPQVLYARTRRTYVASSGKARRPPRLELDVVASPGAGSTEAPALHLEARLLSKDGAQHGEKLSVDLQPGPRGLAAVSADTGWEGDFFPSRGESTYRLAVKVTDRASGISTTREERLK
jgi:hypothetical protein